MNAKKIHILYWTITGLFAAMMLFSTVPNIMATPEAVAMISGQLGYPEYFVPYIGVLKLLGVIGILIPSGGRLKEWAYAGLAFDLLSAVYSFIAIGLPVSDWFPMVIFIIPGVLSYLLYHRRKKVRALQTAIA